MIECVIICRLDCLSHVKQLVVLFLRCSTSSCSLQATRSHLFSRPQVHARIPRGELAVHRCVVVQVDKLAWEVVFVSFSVFQRTALPHHFYCLVRPREVGLLEGHCWQETIHLFLDFRRDRLFILIHRAANIICRWDCRAVEANIVLLGHSVMVESLDTVHSRPLFIKSIRFIVVGKFIQLQNI